MAFLAWVLLKHLLIETLKHLCMLLQIGASAKCCTSECCNSSKRSYCLFSPVLEKCVLLLSTCTQVKQAPPFQPCAHAQCSLYHNRLDTLLARCWNNRQSFRIHMFTGLKVWQIWKWCPLRGMWWNPIRAQVWVKPGRCGQVSHSTTQHNTTWRYVF